MEFSENKVCMSAEAIGEVWDDLDYIAWLEDRAADAAAGAEMALGAQYQPATEERKAG